MDVPRDLQKAVRVLGPYDALTRVEEKGKEKEKAKARKRQKRSGRKGGRMDNMLEVLSKALDLS